jgi:NAD(P) transhydrogenase subunit alpha
MNSRNFQILAWLTFIVAVHADCSFGNQDTLQDRVSKGVIARHDAAEEARTGQPAKPIAASTKEESEAPDSNKTVPDTNEVDSEDKGDASPKDDESRPSGDDPEANNDAIQSRHKALLAGLTVFVLAIFVGFEVITKVPPTLHTPLMSGSNAISGITLVGAVTVTGVGTAISLAAFTGFIAIILATVNVVGGFLVTHRMLSMFKKR